MLFNCHIFVEVAINFPLQINHQWCASIEWHVNVAVLSCHSQTMHQILNGTVLLCKSFLPTWKWLSGLIRFGLVALRRSWRVLVKWVTWHFHCIAHFCRFLLWLVVWRRNSSVAFIYSIMWTPFLILFYFFFSLCLYYW